MHIQKFNSFNEGLLSDFSSKIGSTFKKIKSFFTKSDGDILKKWDITYKKISDTYYELLHNELIIAELKLDGEKYGSPLFKLTLYYYESEIHNVNDLHMEIKFYQKEHPYGRGSKNFATTKSAIDFLIQWWSTKTKSGKSKNSNYKIKL